MFLSAEQSGLHPVGSLSPRQGCPLSPLLFVITLEPFAEVIKTNPMIKGVTAGTQQHIISLCADSTLLFDTEPMSTLRHVLADIQTFSYTQELWV